MSYESNGLSAGLIIFYLVIFAIAVVISWKLFEKAGVEGWKSIIPFYNLYCYFQLAWGNGWVFLLLLVPIVNFVIAIMVNVRLARAFGKGPGFAIGLIFLSFIFQAILAFDKESQYIGPNGEYAQQ